MSPELLKKSYNEKTDIWSIGVILYIFLCGYFPFNGESPEDTRAAILAGELEFDDEEWGEISAEAKDLVTKMLTVDPAKRISANEALDHPWLKGNAPTVPLKTKTIENLTKFSARNRLQKAILSFIATHFVKKTECQDLVHSFECIDKNKNGRLSETELKECVAKVMGVPLDHAEKLIKRLIQEADLDKSGEIEYSEFIVSASNYNSLVNEESLKQVFVSLDKNNDGKLSAAEIKKAMSGICIPLEHWDELIKECDQNADGQIDFKEFTDLLQKHAVNL